MTSPPVGHHNKPAPEPLLLVQSFVNTWDRDEETDLLDRADTARPWLSAAGLAGPRGELGDADLIRARRVRESMRALLRANVHGTAPTPEDLVPLRELALDARTAVAVDADGGVSVGPPPSGLLVDGLTRLLLIVRDAQLDGTWPRLKVCANDECEWAFYDRSHARRGAWCEMATCGNIIKNRNLRARRAGRA
jgi:predicted RNA-binding Zn ribbon-like protein